jgi:hypothetical protein
VLPFKFDEDFTEVLDWVNKNSNGKVAVRKSSLREPYIAFENLDDALVFRIKYGV